MSQYNSQESALLPPFLWTKNRFFFSKIPPGKISYSIVPVLYTYEHSKTTEKPTVMSFSPWIGCQTHVPSVCLSHGTVTMKKFSVYRASLRSRITAHADEIVNVITLQQPY